VVISGRLKVMISDDEGREVILRFSDRTEFFGEMGLIDDHPRSASVVDSRLANSSLSSGGFQDASPKLRDDHDGLARTGQTAARSDQRSASLALMDVYGRWRTCCWTCGNVDGRR